MPDSKYLAIKVKGLGAWLWFAFDKIEESEGKFIGRDGWGFKGNAIAIDVRLSEIVGRLESPAIFYNR